MEGSYSESRQSWRHTCLLLAALSSLLIQVAEGNYDALYDYERTKEEDSSYISEAPKKIDLPRPIHYSGQNFSVLQVSKDGMVGFGPDTFVTHKIDPKWTQGFMEMSDDQPLIIPFHHQGYVPSPLPQLYHGRMYIQQYDSKSNLDAVPETKRHQDFLAYLGDYLAHSSVTIETFKPDQYIVITWENITDYATVKSRTNGSCEATLESPCPSATFQLVIAADSTITFAIFNYAKMEILYSENHLTGMNGGKGRGWTGVVKCVGTCIKNKHQKQLLASLPSLQGSSSKDRYISPETGRSSDNVRGRFLFVISGDVIVRGGCLPLDNKADYVETVEVYPHQVAMLGGQIIRVSGRCQDPYTTVYCRFDQQSQKITAGKITSGMVGSCPVPRLTSRGQVRLEVSSDRSSWTVYTHVIVIPPVFVGRLIDQPEMEPWFQTNPSELHLSWDPQQLATEEKARVDIVLVQYQETNSQITWTDLVTLAEKQPNSGTFRFNPGSDLYRYSCQTNCEDHQLGLVEIRLSENSEEYATKRQFISIGPLPLGWYVNGFYRENVGEDWPRYLCEDWAIEQENDKGWTIELPPCPCSLQQALADWGRWQAEVGCSVFNENLKCTFHKGAKHCVRSVQPTSTGAGSLCCYDDQNNLMYSGDTYQGSTSNRAHAWGATPYNKAGRVPAMSYWLNDLVPYFYCCKWTENDYCSYYTDQRPTKDCRTYESPGSATIYGDPHVTTFDDESYHFCGAGDFWLVSAPRLSVQARFLQLQQGSNSVAQSAFLKPTHMTAVAIKGDLHSDIVTFTLSAQSDLHSRRLDVKINNNLYFFDTVWLIWQDFRGFSILNNKYLTSFPDDQNHSNFTVLLDSGAGVQVAERNGLLHVVVLLPPFAKDNSNPSHEPASKGLLGTWDEKRSNDYMLPSGESIPYQDAQDESVKYHDFSLKWAVQSAGDALFQFSHPVTSNKEPHPCSTVDYTEDLRKPSRDVVAAECGFTQPGDCDPCTHDYYVTGNRSTAINTRTAQANFRTLRRLQRKIWSCGWLNIPFAVKNNTNYTAGNTVRVTGCRTGPGSSGSVSGGPTEYKCIQNETDHQPFWEPYQVNTNLCTGKAETANLAMILGIVAAVFVLIVIVVVAFIFYRRRSKKQSISKPTASVREEVTMDPGTDEVFIRRQKSKEKPQASTGEKEGLAI